ncbi:MAG TPA: hypothetical protein VFF65_04765 [Phycisphaerales bacterium]|nr:hypothetical protein [Phycisphaerales bacterium]
MIKSLQKYKMYVLVVAGVLIIVSFLLADALRQIGTYSRENERVYTLDGDKVTREEHNRAGVHLEGLKQVFGTQMTQNLGLDDDVTQWQLIVAAAERAGLLGGPVDGRAAAQQLISESIMVEAQRAGYNDWRAYLKEKAKLTDEQLDGFIANRAEEAIAKAGRTGNVGLEGANAFAEYRALLRLLRSYRAVPQTSEHRLAAEARRQFDVALVKYVYVPLTEARIAAAPAPTPEQMQAQFDKFKDTPVGTGENGAGYKQNDRITYSWFSVDKTAISRAVRVDPIEVQKRSIPRQGPDGKVDPAVRRQIEDEIRGELTQRALDDFTSALRTEFLRNSALLPDKDGYKVLPPDWKKPDLNAALAAAVNRLAADRKTVVAAPQVHTVTEPQDVRAFYQTKDVGSAMIARPGQNPLLLAEVLFSAKELGKPAGKVPAQVGLPIATPFTGPDGNLYFAMLDGAIPSASPKSLDEVRPAVEKDLRRAHALETLKKELEGSLAPIVTLGMTEAPTVLNSHGYPGLTVQSGMAQRFTALTRGRAIFSEQGMPAQDEVQDLPYLEEIMGRAEKLDPSLKLGPDTAPERTFVHALPRGPGVVLTQITGLKPLTQESFRIVVTDPRIRALLDSKDMGTVQASPFKTDTLVKRFNVTGLERGNPDEAP